MQAKEKEFWHGGDYNPEQWLKHPDILTKDIEYFKKAKINTVSVGIFSWACLEPEEGVYKLDWLIDIVDDLYNNGISVIMATPSGSRPKWLADKYEEVLRVTEDRRRNLYGLRHNHCYTSPVYRKKVRAINIKLAQQFDKHPGVRMWHLSNEYGGDCHCPLCQAEFRKWLKARYTSIDELNDRWCTTFWSHRYNSFEQIESPSSIGETQLHALNLEWKRFVTAKTSDFIEFEVKALRDGGATKLTTANLMYDFAGLDYQQLAKTFDVVSYDNYPTWHKEAESKTAADSGLQFDIMRSLKKKPFILMESCPSSTNWQKVSKLKRPGLLKAASLQSVAHGSDSVMYFQIRQSRGASEKFHGAVIDHYGGSDTRVFKEVTEVGESLEKLAEIQGSNCKSEAAVIYDRNNDWAIKDAQGPRNKDIHYKECVDKSYKALRCCGINVDVVGLEVALNEYRLVAAPMQYLYDGQFADKVRSFVENGGVFLTTYQTGIVDELDRCYLGETPAGLTDVLGLRRMEIDGLYDGETNSVVPTNNAHLNMTKEYECRHLCELIKVSTATSLMNYDSDFYKGMSAFTHNEYGNGHAYYVCADMEQAFYDEAYKHLVEQANIKQLFADVPVGIEITTRDSEDAQYIFIQNFGDRKAIMTELGTDYELLFGTSKTSLEKYDTVILKRMK